MNRLARLAGALSLCAIFAGCETTGDPTQGALFGWSEAKARERQNERRASVAQARAELADEEAKNHALEAHGNGTQQQIAAAQWRNERAVERLRVQQAALIAKIERLENESPTPASASRARAWRRKINSIAAETAVPVAERTARLRAVEAEIDTALEQARR